MLAIQIQDVLGFMNHLLRGEAFDQFELLTADIVTAQSFSLDGRLMEAYYDTGEWETLKEAHRTHALWKDVRPLCYQIIRGKKTPLSFKIILKLPVRSANVLLSKAGIRPELYTGLFINLQYRNRSLLITTGISVNGFVPGKEADHVWEDTVRRFLAKNQIPFEEV